MTKNLLVASPYLNNIGGTEIEALIMAVYFYNTNSFKTVTIFTPLICKNKFFKEIIGSKNIRILHYPIFFNSKSVLFLNKIFKKSGLKIHFLEYFYWMIISIKYNSFFLLTYTNCSYFFPLFNFYNEKKKYIAKITMWHYKQLPPSQKNIYSKFNNIIVFNEEQKLFWIEKNLLRKTICMDIMIFNEPNLLNLPPKKFEKDYLVFGYLGRISREKNIVDMLFLIDFLNNQNNKKCKLIIQGDGDISYLEDLELLIDKLNLKNFVEFNRNFINPLQTHFFYERVDVFLVTSTSEGGPMTALEAVAGGCCVLGYNIGAMQARFGSFPYVVNHNFDMLCHSTLSFLNLSKYEKQSIVKEFRDFYKLELSNSTKAFKLSQLFK
ncbi:Glycosyltransferase involved in cell wall bisynthesis [Flavobacterium micromati]|uniref:Glycosyltransferase involved in cell wall bisynthesis n=2 Tax=Flavobacterium micromati TaxID=229205 RepID=A0A1M5H6T5_9FLAO|nr:Glycosyltransferase involved in cell wall bisynthesis [Flavobacterium micromati]